MTIKDGLKLSEQGYQKMSEANGLMFSALKNAFLFTWQWWFGIALVIIPWILWFLFRKKESTGRLLLAGFVSILITFPIQSIAVSLGGWSYPFKIFPYTPILFPMFDLSMLPVAVMFFIQIFPNINPFIKGIVFACLGAFVLEPLFEKLQFYNSKGWPHIADFFIHFSIFMISYWFSRLNSFEKIKSNDQSDRKYDTEYTATGFMHRRQKVK